MIVEVHGAVVVPVGAVDGILVGKVTMIYEVKIFFIKAKNFFIEQPKMQMSIRINKKLDLGPMLSMLGSMSQSGWDDR